MEMFVTTDCLGLLVSGSHVEAVSHQARMLLASYESQTHASDLSRPAVLMMLISRIKSVPAAVISRLFLSSQHSLAQLTPVSWP